MTPTYKRLTGAELDVALQQAEFIAQATVKAQQRAAEEEDRVARRDRTRASRLANMYAQGRELRAEMRTEFFKTFPPAQRYVLWMVHETYEDFVHLYVEYCPIFNFIKGIGPADVREKVIAAENEFIAAYQEFAKLGLTATKPGSDIREWRKTFNQITRYRITRWEYQKAQKGECV